MVHESGVKWHVFHDAADEPGKPKLYEFVKADERDQFKVSDEEAALIERWVGER